MMNEPSRFLSSAALLVATLLISACGDDGDVPPPPPSSSSTVTAVHPADGASDVLTNTPLSVTFSRAMDATTITSSSFSLAGSSPVAGTIAYDAASFTATFTPDAPLAPGIDYGVTLTTSVADAAGRSLASVFTSRFSTEPFIRRVSVTTGGGQASGASANPVLSADGRYVAFASLASDLVSDDTNLFSDIFLHDTQRGSTTRVSVATGGAQANGASANPVLSADGRYVAFASLASDLVSDDTNLFSDIFLHDTQRGSTTRVSVATGGAQANGASANPVLSADGRYVAFHSFASNLLGLGGDLNGSSDVFVHDTQSGSTTRVSVDSSGGDANSDSASPALSADGRYVAFASLASDLVSGDGNNDSDIFVYDIQNRTTTRVSVATGGIQADDSSFSPALSADGRYVAFESGATNLVSGDTNLFPDIFLHDTQRDTTTRVSVASSGGDANSDSFSPALSADGRYVAFHSFASNLAPLGDINGVFDVFRTLNAAP